MTKLSKRPLSKKSKRLLDDFDTDAKHHGIMEEYGNGEAVVTAEKAYQQSTGNSNKSQSLP